MRIGPTRIVNLGVALAVASLLVVAAQSPMAAQHAAKTKFPTIRMGYLENNPQWAPTLDPAVVSDQNSSWLTQLMYGALVNLKTVNGKIVLYNDLAAKRTLSKNGKAYTFYIRKNARFANGDPVTAQDVVFTLRRALSKTTASPVNYYDALIAGYDNYTAGKSSYLGVKALNQKTVQIKLSKKAAYFLYAFTYPVNFILDHRILAGKKTDTGGTYLTATCKAAAQGASGPFKPVCNSNASNDVTSFYRGGSTPTLTLIPNPHYYGPRPHARLVIPAIADNQTGLRDFQSGGLDQTWGVPAQDQNKFVGKPGAYRYPNSGIEYLGLNVNEAPFSNKNCRLALAYAIDRVQLVKKYLHGAYKPLYTMVPPGFVGYFKGHKGVPYYNAKLAKQYLAKCQGGIHVKYLYRNDTTDRNTEAAAIQSMAAKVGIQLTLQGVPRSDWLNYVVHNTPLSKTHTAMAYGDWFMDYPDPQDYLDILLYGGHSENFSGWNNKQYDSLIDRADVATKSSTRAKLYIQAQKLVLNAGAVIPYDNFTAFDLVNTKKVKGLVPSLNNGVVWAKNNDWSKVS